MGITSHLSYVGLLSLTDNFYKTLSVHGAKSYVISTYSVPLRRQAYLLATLVKQNFSSAEVAKQRYDMWQDLVM